MTNSTPASTETERKRIGEAGGTVTRYHLRQGRLRGSVLEISLSSNKYIYVGIGAILILQLGFVYLPFMNALFGSAPLGLAAWTKAAPAVLIVS